MGNGTTNRRRLVVLAGLSGFAALLVTSLLLGGAARAQTDVSDDVTTIPGESTVTVDEVNIANSADACAAIESGAEFSVKKDSPLGVHAIAPGVTATLTGSDDTGYTATVVGGVLVDVLLKSQQDRNNWYHFDPAVLSATPLFAPDNKEVSHITFCIDKVVAAKAKVKKASVPAGTEAGWTFTLTGPGTAVGGEQVTTTGDGYVQFSTPLVAGSYTITEAGKSGFDFTSKSSECTFSVAYPGDSGRTFACAYTNTQRGALQVAKAVNWNGVTPDEGQTFEICITGPSYPNGNCKTADFDGATLTWSDLLPGNYDVDETNPGVAWTVSGGDGATAEVDPGQSTTAQTITNTRKLGSMSVNKSVNWNGVTPDEDKTFSLCITGPSYPSGNCKTVDFDGGTLTWTNLIPGSYTTSESNPGSSWIVTASVDGSVVVPTDGGAAAVVAEFTNTRKLGSLQVSKAVNWNGITPDDEQTFEICVTGPSYPSGNCKTADFDGATLTWTDLIPGAYSATETAPGGNWSVAGSPTGTITVPSNGGAAANAPVITNTRKLGSLQVTKSVNWTGVAPDDAQSFALCVTGPSYPNGNCKTVGANGGTATWSNLIPGAYTATETNPGSSWTVTGSPSGVITVPADGSTAESVPVITNVRKLGSLSVTKSVDWNGITPVAGQEFSICITGPSFPEGDCKAFTAPDDLVQTWTDLIPGSYAITEDELGVAWTQSGDTSMTVPSNGGVEEALVTNTLKLGSLIVAKTVDWNNTPVVDTQTFEICIQGKSYPTGDCKTVGSAGGVLTWSGLVPGVYAVTETDPGNSWTSVVADSEVLVSNGGAGSTSVTNTHKPAEALGEQLARTGAEDTLPLVLASVVILFAAARRPVRRLT